MTSGREAIEEAADPLETRGIIVRRSGGRFRVRDRNVLRYYARTIEHLLAPPAVPTSVQEQHRTSDARQRFEGVFPSSRAERHPQEPRIALRHAPADRASRAASSPARRSKKRSPPRARCEAKGLTQTLDYLGESVGNLAEADAATRDYLRIIDAIVAAGHRAATCR